MQHPTIESVTTADDVTNWYWTVAQLREIARRLDVPVSGGKAELTDRLVAALSGKPLPAAARRAAGPQLTRITGDTVVPCGQRMTVAVRTFMVGQVGEDFRFDAAMREFFADPRGRTFADAVSLWRSSRGQDHRIDGQFEYNRFTRAYWVEHPDATASQVRRAWQRYKQEPVSGRGKA